MEHKFTFPGRRTVVETGDIELDLEISARDFEAIHAACNSNLNRPFFRLRVTCDKTLDGGSGEGVFVFENWRFEL